MFETVLADLGKENPTFTTLIIIGLLLLLKSLVKYLDNNWHKVGKELSNTFNRFQDTKAKTDTYSYELARDQQESQQRREGDLLQQILNDNQDNSQWLRNSVDKRLDSIEGASTRAADTSLSTYTQQDIMGRRIQVIETEVKTHRELLRALETGQNELKEGHGRIESLLNVQTYYQELSEGNNAENIDD